MPPIPVGHVLLKYRIGLVGDAEPMLVTIGAETTAASATERLAVANGQLDNFGDNLLGPMSNQYSIQGVDAVFGTASGDLPVSSTDPPRPGGNVATPLVSNTALLVSKLSGQGGRRNRGRMYVPGYAEADVDPNGNLAGATVAVIQTGYTNFLLGIETGPFTDRAVIFHASAPFTPTVIESLRVNDKVATQRRRLRP